jgi:hypothetical protein
MSSTGEYVEVENGEMMIQDGTCMIEICLSSTAAASVSINGSPSLALNSGTNLNSGALYQFAITVRKTDKVTVTSSAAFTYLRLLNFSGI